MTQKQLGHFESTLQLEDDWQAAPPSEKSCSLADPSPPPPAVSCYYKAEEGPSTIFRLTKHVTLFYLRNLISLYLPPGGYRCRTWHTNHDARDTEVAKLDGVKYEEKLGVAAHTCNSSTQETEAGGL